MMKPDDQKPEESEEREVEPTAESTVAELASLGSPFVSGAPGALSGGAFGSPGGPAAGAILLGLLQEDKVPEEPGEESDDRTR